MKGCLLCSQTSEVVLRRWLERCVVTATGLSSSLSGPDSSSPMRCAYSDSRFMCDRCDTAYPPMAAPATRPIASMPSIGQVRDGALRGSKSAIRSMAASFQCLPHDLKSPKSITYSSPHHRFERTFKCFESLATLAVSCRESLRCWIVPVQLDDPRVPVPEALPETLGLGDDDGHVGQLDLTPDLVRLRVHELADAVQHLLFHGQYLRVDLAPVKGLLERRIARYALAVHGLAPVAAARRGVDVGPPTDQLDLIHSPHIRSRA